MGYLKDREKGALFENGCGGLRRFLRARHFEERVRQHRGRRGVVLPVWEALSCAIWRDRAEEVGVSLVSGTLAITEREFLFQPGLQIGLPGCSPSGRRVTLRVRRRRIQCLPDVGSDALRDKFFHVLDKRIEGDATYAESLRGALALAECVDRVGNGRIGGIYSE